MFRTVLNRGLVHKNTWGGVKRVNNRFLNGYTFRGLHFTSRYSQSENLSSDEIGTEKEVKKFQFKTETHKLLDIVANSLYSEKEVFIRELVSNSSDAITKHKHLKLVSPELLENSVNEEDMFIEITLDKENKQFIIRDNGIGMTEEELHQNLGTIASSGSKAFLENMASSNNQQDSHKIIGQFGVGFYSSFIVGNNVKVYSKSAKKGEQPFVWMSEGKGDYTVVKADEDIGVGTKIVIQLKDEEFLKDDKVIDVIKKYSNYLGVPVKLNDKVVNDITPLWTKNPSEISEQEHTAFFKSISNSFTPPKYHLVYKADGAVSVKSILYIAERPAEMDLFMRGENGAGSGGLTLYSNNVMIMKNTTSLLPHWMRFVQGVVSSEDIPLNLSREMLQKGLVIQRLKQILSNRILKWLNDIAKKEPDSFNEFYNAHHRYFKEAAILEENAGGKEDVMELLRFATSNSTQSMTSLKSYTERMIKDQKSIYFLCRHPSELMNNPYYEPFKKANIEVLLLPDPADKVLARVIDSYNGFPLIDIESKMASAEVESFEIKSEDEDKKVLDKDEARKLADWILHNLGMKMKVHAVEVAKRSTSYPLLAVGHELDNDLYVREAMKQSLKQGETLPLTPITVEVNPKHDIMVKLPEIIECNPKLAELICEQLINNARLIGGLVELDATRSMLGPMNQLLNRLVKLETKENSVVADKVETKEEAKDETKTES